MKTHKGAWSTDIFLIEKVQHTDNFVRNYISFLQVKYGIPDRYSLKTLQNEPLIGTYYNEELMEVKLPQKSI